MDTYKTLIVLLLCLANNFSFAQTIDNRYELTVSQTGDADFKTIQEAINHVRDHAEKRVTILIRPGIYNEKVVIPSFKRNISLKGGGRDKTIIRFDDYSGKPFRGIDVTGNTKFSTYTSYTVFIGANDCALEDLTIANTSGRVGQAVALHTEGDRILIRNCAILGNQDSLYLAKGGTRNMIENCHISGTTDFIFGGAAAYFLNCTIESLSNSYLTAASTSREDAYGFVFQSCNLIAHDSTVTKVFLGRPWRPHAQTVFLNCTMGTHIVPEGWHAWPGDKNFPDKEKTAFYAEYASGGRGAQDLSKRAPWSKQLRKKDVKRYTQSAVLAGWDPLRK
ncbi:pectinesterase family protein [Sphingobacterium paludis]|uniref:Pectinesterase n=1 Tax=Sphingobacterium paludis TaxID=1476465 RepID=A0A4R7D595_9SPHI|nr:pectinesterase family protein [Sphingobacterium paludis]TDS14885.1 pectinesterase [Sphingobacterium paludis]